MNNPFLERFTQGPPRPTATRWAGATSKKPGTERYSVPAAGAICVELCAGDELRLINDEGLQHGEVVAVCRDGRTHGSLLSVPANDNADGLRDLLAGSDRSFASLKETLRRKGVVLEDAKAVRVFGNGSPAGDQVSFHVQDDGFAVIAAPGELMDFQRQDTATPLTVTIKRAEPARFRRFEAPSLLADPKHDLRVVASTARAYTVKAGEYIQIIDVDGRQCTDFQCFDARKLDRGIEHPLDVTTTRTVQGHVYPGPGPYAKYFDHAMTPLVEVVQDTCGRHDTLALACSSKYYADIGYPGHVNCTDNFNGALQPFGIAARPGWMAANFFYNTGLDEHGVLYFDEPWSRPGDYVLLRALTDLVCVSSACPDDISPANGWVPTDIHVRTYASTEKFQRASAWRALPDSEPIMTRQTAFHGHFEEKTRDFVEYKGFWLPNSFPAIDPVEQYWACRNKSVLIDLSALRKFEVTGPDAENLMQWVLTRDVKKLGDGQVVYSAMCYPHGGMIDDGTLFKLGPANFRWIGGSEEGGAWMREQAKALGLNAYIRSSTDQMHNLAVQGPDSRDLLNDVIWTNPLHTPIADLRWFRFTPGKIGGPDGADVVVSRTGYTGELGYEVFCHPKDGSEVYEAICAAGQPRGLTLMGLDGLDLVRIEAGLIFAGFDFCDQTDPFEAGIGFTVPLKSKTDDFVGREALLRRKANPMRRFVGFETDGNDPVGHGDGIFIQRAKVGEVTSAMRSPGLKKVIGLGRIDVAYSDTGTDIEIGKLDGHIKRVPARISGFPHYDPKKERPRS